MCEYEGPRDGDDTSGKEEVGSSEKSEVKGR
jgi:hypothetical protein